MQKAKKKRRFKLRFFLIAGVIVYAAVTLITQQVTLAKQAEKKLELQAQLSELELESSILESKLDYIGTPSYIEQSVREKLGWVYDGELIFRIQDGGDGGTTPATGATPTASAKPTEAPTPTSTAAPTGTAKPAESAKPTGTAKPAESAKPTGTAKPAKSAEPSATP